MSKNPDPFDNYIEKIKKEFVDSIDKIHERQRKIDQAFFESSPQSQKSSFCKSLRKQGFTPREIEGITGKSQSTINRLLND